MIRADWPDDSIPALDDGVPDAWEAEPWPGSEPGASPASEAINRAIPLRKAKPTISEWLDSFAADLGLCTDRDEVEAAVLRDDVCKAGRTLTGDARARLQKLIDTALAPFRDAGDR